MIWDALVTILLFWNAGTTDTVAATPSVVYAPPLESILYNPAVHKRELGNNSVQASTFWAAGQPQFIVHFKKKALNGSWQSFYSNGQPCDSGAFVKNLPNGTWKTWYPDGRLKTVRTYHAEKYHYIKNDLEQNHPKAWRFALTKWGREAGRYFKPQYEGNDSLQRSMLQKIEHNTTAKNAYYQAPFKYCLHHGLFATYNADGTVKDSGHYENGLPEGLWKTAEAQNGFGEGMYHQGRRIGQWKFYNSTGKLAYTQWYTRNGKAVNTHHFRKH